MQKILAFSLWTLAGASLIYSLAVLAFPQKTLGFTSSTRLIAEASPETAEVGGILIELSKDTPGLFYLTDRATPIAVQYPGALPEFARVQASLVVTGQLRQEAGKNLLQASALRPMNAFQAFSYMGGYGFFVWVSYTLAFFLLAFNFFLPLSREQDLRRSLARKAGRRETT
jgi:heme exporter protein CcmD